MACNNCGNKSSRHTPRGDIDNSMLGRIPSPKLVEPASPPPANFDPSEINKLSYEELKNKRQEMDSKLKEQAELFIKNLSEPMKRLHVEMLVSIVNAETAGSQGISPEQALVTLKELLSREEFFFVSSIYPKLKEKVEERVKVLESERILLE